LGVLVAGVVISLGLFVGYKNRPGAYQGSPSYFMDPSQQGAGFQLNTVSVPDVPAHAPADPGDARLALTGYARAFDRLIAGYYILDRNYNYDFHNRLFWRSTPLLADVRAYAAFTFDRAPVLERMTAEFVKTEAGLQHATHLYEGEGKVLGVRLAEILDKHAKVLAAGEVQPVTGEFVTVSKAVHDLYANRIVGF
jgi:hypothetical protein